MSDLKSSLSFFLFSFIRPFEQFQTDDMLFFAILKIFITFRISKLKPFKHDLHRQVSWTMVVGWQWVSKYQSGPKWTVQIGQDWRFQKTWRSWAKAVAPLSENWPIWTKVDVFMSWNGRSWIKVDGHFIQHNNEVVTSMVISMWKIFYIY